MYHLHLEWYSLTFWVGSGYTHFFWLYLTQNIFTCYVCRCPILFLSCVQWRCWSWLFTHPNIWHHWPHRTCRSLLPQMEILFLISLPEMFGCHIVHGIYFFELLDCAFAHSFWKFPFEHICLLRYMHNSIFRSHCCICDFVVLVVYGVWQSCGTRLFDSYIILLIVIGGSSKVPPIFRV